MNYAGKYAEAKDGWDSVGPLAFFHREKDEVRFGSPFVTTGSYLLAPEQHICVLRVTQVYLGDIFVYYVVSRGENTVLVVN